MCSHINLEYLYSTNRYLLDYDECSELLYKQSSQIQNILKSLIMRNRREDESLIKLDSFNILISEKVLNRGCTLSINQDKIIKFSRGNIMESKYNEVKYLISNMRLTVPYSRIVNDVIVQIQILMNRINMDSNRKNDHDYTRSDNEIGNYDKNNIIIEYSSKFNDDQDFLDKQYNHYKTNMDFNMHLLRSYLNNLVVCKMLLELDLERIFYIRAKLKAYLHYYSYRRKGDYSLYIRGLEQLIIYRNLFKINMVQFLGYFIEPVLRSCYTDFLIFKQLFKETLDMSRKYLIYHVNLMGKNILLSDKYI